MRGLQSMAGRWMLKGVLYFCRRQTPLHCSGQVKADLCLLAITAVIANHGVIACVHSHRWQECLHSLIFIPLSAEPFLDGFPFEKICSCSAPCVRQGCVRARSDSTHTAVCVHSTPQSLQQLSPFWMLQSAREGAYCFVCWAIFKEQTFWELKECLKLAVSPTACCMPWVSPLGLAGCPAAARQTDRQTRGQRAGTAFDFPCSALWSHASCGLNSIELRMENRVSLFYL